MTEVLATAFACVWFLAVVASVAVTGTASRARAQAPGKGAGQDVLNAPPPTPELTELDEREPPAELPKPAPSPPDKPASRAPATRQAQPAAAKPKPAPPAASSAPVSAPPSAAAADAPKPPVTAVTPVESPAQAPDTPPPPAVDGDFAGSGANDAPVAAPQDDFEPEAQEYTRPPEKREYSVRIDLLNWLLLGRISVELEAALWEFLSVQITPVFVVSHTPIAINYAGLDSGLTQRSRGLGPISGVSLGVGAWLWGKPFKGYVLRLEFTNYAYSYRSADAAGQIDRVDFSERRAILFIGSHSRFGAFTFAGGFGLGYELHQVQRCGLSIDADSGAVQARESGCHGKQQIALDRIVDERADLNGPLHPVYFQARFSVGVVF